MQDKFITSFPLQRMLVKWAIPMVCMKTIQPSRIVAIQKREVCTPMMSRCRHTKLYFLPRYLTIKWGTGGVYWYTQSIRLLRTVIYFYSNRGYISNKGKVPSSLVLPLFASELYYIILRGWEHLLCYHSHNGVLCWTSDKFKPYSLQTSTGFSPVFASYQFHSENKGIY